jgi:hypothetical protein
VSHEPQLTPKRLAQNQTHKVKNFAYLASQPRPPKSDGLQNDLAKTPADNSRNIFCKWTKPKNDTRAMTTKSKRPLPKDSRRQTKHDLKD